MRGGVGTDRDARGRTSSCATRATAGNLRSDFAGCRWNPAAPPIAPTTNSPCSWCCNVGGRLAARPTAAAARCREPAQSWTMARHGLTIGVPSGAVCGALPSRSTQPSKADVSNVSKSLYVLLIWLGLEGQSILPTGIPARTRSATQPTSVTAPSRLPVKRAEQYVPKRSACSCMPNPNCRKLLMQAVCRPASRADCSAGSNKPVRMPMMEITTNNSIRVKPHRVQAPPCNSLPSPLALISHLLLKESALTPRDQQRSPGHRHHRQGV